MIQGLAGLIDAFSPATARAGVQALRQADRGSLIVTNGLRDLRLRRTDGGLLLEGVGSPVEPGGARELIRQLLCALFWEDAVLLHEPEAEPRDGVSALRVDGDPLPLLDQLEQGFTELGELREKVPAMDAIVAVSGAPPPPADDSATAKLFRAAKSASQVHLGTVAQQLGLDALDAAWAVSDLLDAGQAVVKRAPPTLAARRVKMAEELVAEGFSSGLRCAQVARGYVRSDPGRSANWLRRAGEAFHRAERLDVAAACFRACLEGRSDDLAAREGLAASLNPRGPEVDRLRGELARSWSSLGMPQRARRHLELLADPTPEQRLQLLEALLSVEDFAAAAEVAARLAPTLPPAERAGLADRFALLGATGAPLERAIQASGVQAMRPMARALKGLSALLLLAAALLGLEAHLRGRFNAAGQAAREALGRGDLAGVKAAFADLEALAARLPALPAGSCLSRVAPTLDEAAALHADQGLLEERRAALAWRAAPDVVAADQALGKLLVEARTDALRRVVTSARAELAEYRSHISDEIKRLDDLVLSGKRNDALELARSLVHDHARARDAWGGRELPVHLTVRPPDATVTWAGQRLRALVAESGEYELRIPLQGPLQPLTIDAFGHLSHRRELNFEGLASPTLEVELVKRIRETTLPWPTPPAGAPASGVVFLEDPVGLARASTVAKGDLKPPPGLEPGLALLADKLGPAQRLLVVVRSDVRQRRVILDNVDLFLEDLTDPAAPRRATPVRLIPSRVERAPVEHPQGGLTLPSLSSLPSLPALREALLEVVAAMRAEVGP